VTIASVPGTGLRGFPRIALYGGELIFAWTEQASGNDADNERALVVSTATARMPGTR